MYYHDFDEWVALAFLGFFLGVCFAYFFTSLFTRLSCLNVAFTGAVVAGTLIALVTGGSRLFEEITEHLIEYLRQGHWPAFISAVVGFIVTLVIRWPRNKSSVWNWDWSKKQ